MVSEHGQPVLVQHPWFSDRERTCERLNFSDKEAPFSDRVGSPHTDSSRVKTTIFVILARSIWFHVLLVPGKRSWTHRVRLRLSGFAREPFSWKRPPTERFDVHLILT